MIDKLVADAAAEASHKAFCDKEMSESKAKIEDHTSTIEKFTTRKDKANAAIEKLTEELATLADELATMAKQQAAMDEMRAEQKATYAEAKKDFEDGIEGLTMALQILRDYYADKEESLMQADQPATSVHSKATGAATGIIGMLEVAQSDFSKMLADATVEEEAAIKEYEKITQENQVHRCLDHCIAHSTVVFRSCLIRVFVCCVLSIHCPSVNHVFFFFHVNQSISVYTKRNEKLQLNILCHVD